MSEAVAAATTGTESAAPLTSVDIAAQVVESSESPQAETGTETAVASDVETATVTETPSPEPKTEPTAAEISAARKFLQKLGHAETNKRGGNTYLPYLTVEKMLDKYAEEHRGTWETERTTLASQAQELQTYLDELRAGVSGDPKAFLSELANIDPRYKSFLEAPAQAAPQAPAVDLSQMPDGDYQLPDGSRTFTLQGIKEQLVPWLVKSVEAGLLPKVDERLKPLTEREQQEQARAERQRVIAAVQERSHAQLTDAQTWPGFDAHKDDILKALQEDSAKAKAAGKRPSLSLEAAYRQVVIPKLIADDATKRGRLLKDINDAPKSTGISRGAETLRPTGPRSTADIVRATVSKLERQA